MILTPFLITAGVLAGVALTITSFYFLLAKFRPAVHQLPPAPPKSTAEDLKKVLSLIPVVYYTKNEKIPPLNQSECSVCLSSVEEGDKVRFLPDCGHFFHALCIDAWLSSQLSCPFCRSPVNAPANSSVAVESSRTLFSIKEAFLQNRAWHSSSTSREDDDESNGGSEREEGSPV